MEGESSVSEPSHLEKIPVEEYRSAYASKHAKPKPTNGMAMAMLITVAVTLLVGTLVLQGRVLITEPTSGPRTDYNRLIAIMTFTGNVLIGIGIVLLVLLGWAVAIMRTDMPDGVRLNALVATAVIMAAWLVFSFITLTRISIWP